ncbi:MAG TPA: aminopeptidase P family protein [Blastocatellia bacterium]
MMPKNRAQLFRAAFCAFAVLSVAAPLTLRLAPAASADEELAHQPRSEYQARRQKLMDKLKDGITVVIGAREDEFGEANRFRQKNDFMYLTGVETPSAYLMLVPAGLIADHPAQITLFVPPRNLFEEQWTGPQMGPGTEAEQECGIQEVASSDKFNGRLFDLLLTRPSDSPQPGRVKLYTIIPTGSAASLTRESQFVDTVRKAAPQVEIADASRALGEMRKAKSPAEQRILQKAIDITAEAQNDARAFVKPGLFEYEVQAVIEAAFIRNGAERVGYSSIVGSGINSCILHYDANRKKIDPGDTVVADVGAEYSYYTADITRTYPASGKFTPRQREIYQLVLDAQRAAEKAFKPGQTTMHDLNQVAIATMKDSPLRDKEGDTLEKYFIHGLGHWLGMDVHDVGDYSGPIPAGAVFTIEPGIYIPDEKIGVRIEDDYLATETGLVKLSKKIASEPDEVEKLMARSKH